MRDCTTRCALAVLAVAATGVAQTPVDARLLTPVSSYRSKSGSEIKAVITTPLCTPGNTRLQDGMLLSGVVRHVHKVGLGLIHESASMRFDFRLLELPDGRLFPLKAQLTDVVNARERVDKHGRLHGIRATGTLSNRIGQRLAFAGFGHPAMVIPMFALETALFHFPDPEIDFGPGTELELSATFPQEVGEVAACPIGTPSSAETAAALRTVVNALPAWSYSDGEPQDPVNLVYIGSREEVLAAFAAAGWNGSQGHTASSRFNAVRAIVEDRAFADAPMRTLFLDGAAPDVSLQKTLDTFEKRDHLRIWNRTGEEWRDRPVWASAATRDIGTGFAMHPFGFTHRIENDVDEERDRVVRDLSYTGCVDSVRYVPREEPATSTPDYRKGIETDGRVAVVLLNTCREPRLNTTEPNPELPPPLVVRTIRRVTLTARNHFLRDNIIWRSGEAARMGVSALRHWVAQRRVDAAVKREHVEQVQARASLQ